LGVTVEWREDTERVTRYVNQHLGSFAGRWVVEGEEHVVAFTEDLAEHEVALRILLHAPDRLRVVQMRYTWNHLMELTNRCLQFLLTHAVLPDGDLMSKRTWLSSESDPKVSMPYVHSSSNPIQTT
jgi:hypothetical protein